MAKIMTRAHRLSEVSLAGDAAREDGDERKNQEHDGRRIARAAAEGDIRAAARP